MTVLSLFPVMVIRSVAVAIAIVAATAIVTGLLLLPVVLVLLHRHLDRWNLRAKLGFLQGSGTGWRTTIARVMRKPVASIGVALAVLGLIALPAAWLKIRGVTVDVLPAVHPVAAGGRPRPEGLRAGRAVADLHRRPGADRRRDLDAEGARRHPRACTSG